MELVSWLSVLSLLSVVAAWYFFIRRQANLAALLTASAIVLLKLDALRVAQIKQIDKEIVNLYMAIHGLAEASALVLMIILMLYAAYSITRKAITI